MTTYRVDPRTVLDTGVALVELADGLALMGDPAVDRWALGPGDVGPAVEELVGGWRHVRFRLAAALTDLGEAAVDAGGLYVDTETGVSRSLRGGVR